MKTPVNIADRYIKASETKGFNPISKSEYAKKEGISIPGVNDRLKRGKVMFLNMIGRTFIIN